MSSAPLPLQVVRLSPASRLPVRATQGSAGYDVFAAEEMDVPARGKALISLGIAMRVPRGTYGRLAPRSGLAWKAGIDVGAGIIDEDYTGLVSVVLFNHSDVPFKAFIGDRIAQLVLEKIETPPVEEVLMEELVNTIRGAGGFGSTGK